MESRGICIQYEHLGNSDRLMPFRITSYTCSIMEQQVNQPPDEKVFPFIKSLVWYFGHRPYLYSTRIKEFRATLSNRGSGTLARIQAGCCVRRLPALYSNSAAASTTKGTFY